MAESRSTETRDAVVIGAGCAGLSAAVRLAAHGRTVVVVEEAPRLGGRASTFVDRISGQRLDNGQHALFGCYHETYNFLRTIGTAGLAPLDSTLSLVMADTTGAAHSLTCPRWRPPFHLIAGLLSWKALPFVDRLSAANLAGLLWRVRRDGAASAAAQVADDVTVSGWLHQQGQSASLCDWLWYPLAVAALNQDPDVAAARPFVRVVGELFGSAPGAASLGVPTVSLEDLYAESAVRFIEARGGTVLRRTTARVELSSSGGQHCVVAGGQRLSAKTVISSVPWFAFERLWAGAVPASLAPIAAAAGRMRSVPIVTVYLWFDRSVVTDRQLGLVGTRFHWIFNKGGVPGPLYSMVASGAEDLLRQGNDALAALAERELRACVSSAADARCLRSLVVREARATFSLAPGAPPRPSTVTPVPGFYLAGDWTDTGLPGTIESGVLSGHRAAEAAMITP